MENSYNNSLLWKQEKNINRDNLHIKFYESIFSKLPIKTIHDCSCGSGNLTFPIYYMGYQVSGSDISKNMISLAKERAKIENANIHYYNSDFLDMEKHLSEPVDCLISTGNSIPHVPNESVERLFCSASKVIKDKGYFYFDIRNWDKILRDKQRFFNYNMRILEEGYNHLLQVWDYNQDGSITFNLLFHDFDKDGKISGQQYQQVPPYYPLKWKTIVEFLHATGFKIIKRNQYNPYGNLGDEESRKIDVIDSEDDFMKVDWYSVLAQRV